MRLHVVRRALTVIVVLVGLVACNDESVPAADPLQVLRAASSGVNEELGYWKTLPDVLPNVTYSSTFGGREAGRVQVTDSVVVGRVVRTEPARGMLIEPLGEGEDVRTRVVAFDDQRAGWRVLHVTVEVAETLAGSPVDELVLDWTMGAPASGSFLASSGLSCIPAGQGHVDLGLGV